LNCRGRILSLDRPRIMGILNLTPDSFSDGGAYNSLEAALDRVGQMLDEGAEIIDIGGYSSRPGAAHISLEEELDRVYEITVEVLKQFPGAIVSIDTFRSGVAIPLLDLGVHMINDISAGNLDQHMMTAISKYDAPYIMMHMQGAPQDMQNDPYYENISEDIMDFFVQKVDEARAAGIKDLILDPGFGFGKKLSHNYELLLAFNQFRVLDLPLLAGISRKSMIYRLFRTSPEDTLDMSAILHFKLLEAGAVMLRAHDVKEVVRVVELYEYLKQWSYSK